MRQFYLATTKDGLPRAGDKVTLDAEESHHLFTVLRGGRQERLHLVDGRGHRLTAEFVGKRGKLAEIRIVETVEDVAERASPRLVLACAVVKGRRFEWLLEKAVELGAHHVWPLITEHGVVVPGQGKQERWQHLLQSALKQSGRSTLPDLSEPLTLIEALRRLQGDHLLFGDLPDETDETGGTAPDTWTDRLAVRPEPLPARLAVLIGPEGGWSPAERNQLLTAGAEPVSLGPHVLRTETAALAGLTALQSLRRAWGGV